MPEIQVNAEAWSEEGRAACLFHDPRFALAKGDMPPALVSDILDPNLPPTLLSFLVEVGESAGYILLPGSLCVGCSVVVCNECKTHCSCPRKK